MKEQPSTISPTNFSQLSKPIEVKTSKKGFFDQIGDFFRSKPQINIISTSPKPSTSAKIVTNEQKESEQKSKNHSQITDSSKADGFFVDRKSDSKQQSSSADQLSWIDSEKEYDGEINADKPLSFLWIIGGAITIVIIIVIILGSFGLVNLIKNQISEQSLSGSQQAAKQASEMIAAGNYDVADKTLQDALSDEPDNSQLIELQNELYATIGKQLITESLKFKDETTLASNPETTATYLDPKNHFQVDQQTSWQTVENSNYDIKLANNGSFYGVKKYPEVSSLSELEQQFQEQYVGQNFSIVAKKENTTIADSNAVVYVAKIDNMYQISFLMQKYYFGYEISTWIDDQAYNQDFADWQKFLASFHLSTQFDISSYNDLEIFGDENLTIYSWPNKISPDEKNQIENLFRQSIEAINQKLLINYTGPLEVYLYPDWDTFYKYTLAGNSFSDWQNPQMHIVYENANSHQSFGYETTKIIYQKMFSQVKEPLVIEGVAVMLDQTGRDYLALMKNNSFIPLANLVGVNWDLTNGDIKYYEAGLFSQYLIDQYGIDLYSNLSNEKEFPLGYQNVYQKTLPELENEFRMAVGL